MSSISPENTVLGFIGTGVMGSSMASHLLKHGYEMHVYTRTKSKADALLREGAIWQDNPAAVAQACQVVITMVGYPQDVEETYFGDQGLLKQAKAGTYLIDMTTSSPLLAQKIAEKAQAGGVHTIDAPVSGGDIGAQQARLSIMVGGDEQVVHQLLPVLKVMGKDVIHQGPAGAGQHTKMCNQIAVATNMIGVCEAVAYAQQAGLDPDRVLQSIATGAASSWSLSNLAPRIIKGDFAPGFYVKHFIKDMSIALEVADQMQLDLPGLALAKKLYVQLAEQGDANSGTQALYKLLASQTI